ncbi:MAG: RagB/SusD family nutrient uptake outer membrane protein [Tannerellaceae bacterium]|nr:RagB/SusD family nutrient uptake outer membrane protein [Tannerellaceae bacterium]
MYPTTERDMLDLVTSNAYGGFRNHQYDGAFNVATGFHLLGDMASDFGLCSWGEDNWGQLTYANFQNSQGSRNPRRNWSPYLPWISRMEMTIDRINNIEGINETLKKRSIAELECAQAFMTFLIWDFYGGVVIADLETLKDPQNVKILPRKSSEETVAYIENKLKSAITANVLAKSYAKNSADYGRFTEGLCHMLLLKLYMQTHLWDKAISEGREVMKSEYGYELVTDAGAAGTAYANVFASANEGNKETIWATNGLKEYQSHLWYDHVISWSGYKMTRHFFETFEAGDQRAGAEVIRDEGLEVGVLPVKYDMADRTGGDCYTDWIVYRYADAITLLAEAIVQQSGAVTQEAIDLLNQVRTRAGLPAYQSGDFAGKNDFIDKLLWERAHELWYEGCRRQDLIRNNKYVEIMAAKCARLGKTDYITGLGEKTHLFPLPDDAINEFVKGGFDNQQNPGY